MDRDKALDLAHYCALAALLSGLLFGSQHWALGIAAMILCYYLDKKMQEQLFGNFDDD